MYGDDRQLSIKSIIDFVSAVLRSYRIRGDKNHKKRAVLKSICDLVLPFVAGRDSLVVPDVVALFVPPVDLSENDVSIIMGIADKMYGSSPRYAGKGILPIPGISLLLDELISIVVSPDLKKVSLSYQK